MKNRIPIKYMMLSVSCGRVLFTVGANMSSSHSDVPGLAWAYSLFSRDFAKPIFGNQFELHFQISIPLSILHRLT
jgi:hypothetical protein